MSIKFTNTKKWDDVWFSGLTMEQKVLFVYFCEMCDIAGFLEINQRLITLQTGVQEVDDTIKALAKSIIYKDGYIWIKKHLKHQRNLPINPKNGAHKAIVNSFSEYLDKFPEVFDYLPVSDSETIKEMLLLKSGGESDSRGARGALPPPPSTSISNGISNTITVDDESKIAILYKYFVGEDNLMGQGITGGTRKILAEAIQVMPPEEWKVYCVARLNDEFKASPNKFFLEDGWRRYQDKVKDAKKEKQYVEEKRKEAEERRAVRPSEPPEDFKEFVRNFKKK